MQHVKHLVWLLLANMGASESKSLRVYVGGYGAVVTSLDFDTTTSTFSQVAVTPNNAFGSSPSWLTLDPTGRYIFAVNEVDNFQNLKSTGGVHSGSVGSNGKLTPISNATTGAGPVAADLSKDKKGLLVASYAGSMTRYTLNAGMQLSPKPVQTFAFSGTGPNKARQDHPYAHQVLYDPTGQLAFVPDLGSDLLRIFSSDSSNKLTELKSVQFPAGSGPRHLQFYKDPTTSKTYIYVICELQSLMVVLELQYNTEPKATIKQTLSTLPTGVNGATFGAGEVTVSPDGKFVFGGNRQTDASAPVSDNTVVVYNRNANTGTLTVNNFYPTGGKLPRHFALHKSGEWLVIGAQNSDLVVMHRVNAQTGALTQAASFKVSKPTVQIFAP